jgi:cytochrome oxidase Cu insertion factor (SCO1/SenC/PrrC family)
MLTILLAGWSGGVRGLLRRARQSAAGAVPLGALALGTVLLLTGATVRVKQARTPDVARTEGAELPPASYPRLDRAAPPLVLTAQSGDGLDIGALRGRPVLVTFAFAHCETVCPVVVQHTLQAQAALPEALRPVVLVVTLDPWRDTPGRLGAMAAAWGLPASDAHVLSGTVPEVEAVLDAWEMPRFRDEVTGTVTHPALVYVLDRTGRIAFASNGDAATIAELVRRL